MLHTFSTGQKCGLLGVLAGLLLLTLMRAAPSTTAFPYRVARIINYPPTFLWRSVLPLLESSLGVREIGFHAHSYPPGVPYLLLVLQILLHCTYWFFCGFFIGKVVVGWRTLKR